MICKKCNLDKESSCFRTRKKKNGEEYKINWCKKCENERYEKVCLYCGKEYKTKHTKSLFCSKKCSSLNKRKGKIVKCACCSKEIYNSNVDKRYDINNGITLCQNCHKEFHKMYGYGNNTKLQFEKYLIHKKDNTEPSLVGIPKRCND